MRTNVELNDDLLREARKYSSQRTKKGIIDEALRTFVQVKAEEKRRRTYGQRVRDLQERLAHLSLRSSSVELLREDRRR